MGALGRRNAPLKAPEREIAPKFGNFMRALLKDIEAVPLLTRFGRVARIEGLAVEVSGALGAVRLGGQVNLSVGPNKTISCEVVGFRDGRALQEAPDHGRCASPAGCGLASGGRR